jgi:hypothetical protein
VTKKVRRVLTRCTDISVAAGCFHRAEVQPVTLGASQFFRYGGHVQGADQVNYCEMGYVQSGTYSRTSCKDASREMAAIMIAGPLAGGGGSL